MAETDSIWSPDQQRVIDQPIPKTPLVSVEARAAEKRKRKQVTSADITNNPDKNKDNPIIPGGGFPIRNRGYSPGSEVLLEVPQNGSVRFLTKPTYDPQEGVHNWFVQAYDAEGNSLGTGTISTRNGRGSVITTRKKERLTVFRRDFIVR
jgi:hypothetical protein